MSLPNTLAAFLLTDDLPLGAPLGTPRDALSLPAQLQPNAVDPWTRARGSVTADGLAAHLVWELDDGVLAHARADLSGPTTEAHAALERLYTAKFGAPKKARGALSWSVRAGIPAKLTLAPPKKGATLVVELVPDASATNAPAPQPTGLVDFILGPQFLGAPFGKKPPAPREVETGVRLEVHAKKTLLGLELNFGELDEATWTQRFDALSATLTAALGKPKKAKKSRSFEDYRALWWVTEAGVTLQLASREHPNEGHPVRTLSVRAFPKDGLSLDAQREAGLR